MKKTENISLAGYSFIIETDAYQVLDSYLEEIREVFKTDPSADEIVEDIEERIAELLSEKCRGGIVANLNMVEEIRHRIGDPKDLAQDEPSPQSEAEDLKEKPTTEKKWNKGKKLYRDVDQRILGGVCSGLSAYTGIDKVIFRLIFLIITAVGIFGIEDEFMLVSCLAYICLWIAMPAARTVEQKCEMKGKPIDLEGWKGKDLNLGKEVREVVDSPAGKTFTRAGGVFLGIIMLTIGVSGLLGCLFIPSLPSIIGNIPDLRPEFLDEAERMGIGMVTSNTFWMLVTAMTAIFSIWFLYNGVMLSFGLKAPSWKPGLVLFIAWIISILAIAAWTIRYIAVEIPTIMV